MAGAVSVLFMWAVTATWGAIVVYGLYCGLVKRRVIKNLRTKEFATGREAVRRGILYASVGGVGFAICLQVILLFLRR